MNPLHWLALLFSTRPFGLPAMSDLLAGFFKGADLLLFFAHTLIPVSLWAAARQKHVPKHWCRLMRSFAVFILADGLTYAMRWLMFFWPALRLMGVVLWISAICSWTTIGIAIPMFFQGLFKTTQMEIDHIWGTMEALRARLRVRERQILRAAAIMDQLQPLLSDDAKLALKALERDLDQPLTPEEEEL